MESVGWLSSILLGLCGLPMAVEAIYEGTASTVNSLFLWMWFCGEIAGLAYTIYLLNPALILNYAFNSFLIILVIRYKYFPRIINRRIG